jgi:hypothetical protein
VSNPIEVYDQHLAIACILDPFGALKVAWRHINLLIGKLRRHTATEDLTLGSDYCLPGVSRKRCLRNPVQFGFGQIIVEKFLTVLLRWANTRESKPPSLPVLSALLLTTIDKHSRTHVNTC